MNKRISIIAACLALLMLAGCTQLLPTTVPSATAPTAPHTTPTSNVGQTTVGTIPTQPTEEPTTSIVVTPTGTTVVTSPPPTTTVPPAPGVVRLYTCDAQQYETYVALAAEYYAQTGTEVLILTPAEGQSCEEAITGLLETEQAPSLFCIHSQQMLQQLQDRLYDLTGTVAVEQLYSTEFAQNVDGKMLALAMDVGGSGLIYNASKLAMAGFTESDINDFSRLQITVSYLTANKSTLGYAFTAPDFTDEHLMEHLAGLYPDTTQLRAFLDLYLKNCTSKTTTLNYFLKGTTVFFIGGTAEYDQVSALGGNNLGFLPAYSQDTATVQCFSSLYWAVNSTIYSGDVQETVDFLAWLVTNQGSGVPVDRLGMLSPYAQATHADNILEKKLREYIADGNVHVTWELDGNVEDLAAFTAALKTYASSTTDENWAAVEACFS